MNNQSSDKNSSISTSKKVALTVLGALALLTFANVIQAGVNKYHEDDVHTVRISEDGIEVHVEEGIKVHLEEHISVHVDRHEVTDLGELMIEESFDVSPGENLQVAVNDADISVETNNGDRAIIKVYLDGRDKEKAREYFEDQNYEVSREGVNVYVKTYPKRKNYSWNRDGGAKISVEVSIPAEFNVSLKTSDGDIYMDEADGEIKLQSSDGDISAAALTGSSVNIRTSDGDIATKSVEAGKVSISTSDGDIRLKDIESTDISIKTSDGDIKADLLSGNASVATSDGDIVIKSLEGNEMAVRTSDGEIVANLVNASSSQFQTSDGSIMLKSVTGDLTAKTSSGDLNVTLVAGEKVYLRTGDGDIFIRAPHDYSAELFLKGERVRVASGFQFDGKLKENEAEGRINGGGHTIEARTSDGEVVFQEN